MIIQLEVTAFGRAWPLFQSMDHHLAIRAVLSGHAPGKVYVDDPAEPRTALVQARHRFYLAGHCHDDRFNQALRALLVDTIYPQAIGAGEEAFVLYYHPRAWGSKIDVFLGDKCPMQLQRHYYRFVEMRCDWRELLPSGSVMSPVDVALLEGRHLKNVSLLVEELRSECPSVEYFLTKRFGVCLARRDEILGWCLSEHNWRDRCEVGIETIQEYRRRGIATSTASALVERALSSGMTEIGWHCYASNQASIATARKVGFEKVLDYPVHFAYFEEVANLAVNGNVRFQQKRYRQAIEWYERAFRAGDAPLWAYWNAACAYGAVGESEGALRCLHRAVEMGFTDPTRMRDSRHLRSLHGTPEWHQLIGLLQEQEEARADAP
jgi:RimJ/RimL family protein N-acetyltransferase